jgi:hypothetical protein
MKLDEFRAQFGKRGTAATPTSTADDRPRFKDGRLKDEFDRLSEELDLEVLHDPVLGGGYYEAHKREIDRYVSLKAEREAIERSEQYVRPDGMRQSEYEANKDAILLRERRAIVERRIAEMQAQLDAMPAPPRGPAEEEDEPGTEERTREEDGAE